MNAARRQFLKAAGVMVLSLGAGKAFADTRWIVTLPGVPSAEVHRWGMVVDVKKCRSGCTACRKACAHAQSLSVSSEPGYRHIITKETYCTVFLGSGYQSVKEYENSALGTRRYPVFCNHCDTSECVTAGGLPACVEACASEALHYGDLDDPDSAIRKLLRTYPSLAQMPCPDTAPHVYYLA